MKEISCQKSRMDVLEEIDDISFYYSMFNPRTFFSMNCSANGMR